MANKRIKKKKTKRAMTANRIIAAENRLESKRLVQGKKAVMSAEALLKKSLKTFSEQIRVKSVREQREKFIKEQMAELENKDRSRRRGANKNKWTETDLRKYAKLKQEQALLHPHSGRKRGMIPTERSHAEMYAAIKKYEDYVARGIIKEHSILDKYEARDFMEKILTQDELEAMLKEAEEKETKLLSDKVSRLNRPNPGERYNFGF